MRGLAVVLLLVGPGCDDEGGTGDGGTEPGRDAAASDAATGDDAATGRDAGEPDAPPPELTCTITVAQANELEAAVASLGPGVTLCFAPGTYVLGDRVTLDEASSGTADAPAVIAAEQGRGTVVVDANGAEEAFHFVGARFVHVVGLEITGGAYHGIKIDPPSGDLVLSGDVFHDNTRGQTDAQFSDIKGCCLADRVTIADGEFFQGEAFAGDNYQAVDCNGCTGWIVADNVFHDIVGAGFAVNIQFKSGSADTVIERNVIRDCGIGINLGGFGDPAQWGGETHEHVRGVVRNNVVYRCADAGISVLGARDGKVYGNTLFSNGFTPDVRRYAENLDFRNNIFDRPLNLRDGTTANQSANLVLAAPGDPSLFVDAAGGDFHLAEGAAAAIDSGDELAEDLPDDMDGEARPRGVGFDIGADER